MISVRSQFVICKAVMCMPNCRNCILTGLSIISGSLSSSFCFTKMQVFFCDNLEKNEMKFFKSTKDEVENLLGNIEGYDNQTLIFIYLADVLATYEHYHLGFSEDLRREIQNFVLKFITEIIYKGSGSIFKQLMVLVSHCKEKKALTFIQSFLENLINNKEKVSRASQLLFTLCEDDFKVYSSTAKKILS